MHETNNGGSPGIWTWYLLMNEVMYDRDGLLTGCVRDY